MEFKKLFDTVFGFPADESFKTSNHVKRPDIPIETPRIETQPKPEILPEIEEKKAEELTMANLMDLKNKVLIAKQAQQAQHANGKLADHEGEQMVVVGMHIVEDVEIKSAGLIMDKVTFSLSDGSAIDGWHLAATENAKTLIQVLGEGPYNPPLLMEVKSQETKRGLTYYADLIDFYDLDGKLETALAAAQLDHPFAEENQPAQETPPETANEQPA